MDDAEWGDRRPEVLHVLSPNGHRACAGQYALVRGGTRVHGRPLYRMRGGVCHLYAGKNGEWYVGTFAEERNWDCASGLLRCAANADGWPSFGEDPSPPWSRWDSDLREWIEDRPVTVTLNSVRGVPPQVLHINSPNRHRFCTGGYELVEGECANGQPLYKMRGGELYLFTARNGMWHVHDKRARDAGWAFADGHAHHDSARELNWQQVYGFIHFHGPHGGAPPDSCPGIWRVAGEAGTWHEDEQISVTTDSRLAPLPSALSVSCPNGQHACAGIYDLLPNVFAGGHGVYKLRDGERYLYTGNTGLWHIGPRWAKDQGWDCAMGWVCHDEPHGGRPPNHLDGVWSRDVGTQHLVDLPSWQKDPAIRVVVVAPVANPPNAMHIFSCNGQEGCTGRYDLVRGELANGCPLYSMSGGRRFLYVASDGRWHIGAEQAQRRGWDCGTGFLRQDQPKPLPDGDCGWSREDGERWVPDACITVTPDDGDIGHSPILIVEAPVAQKACAGKYVIVPDVLANGHLVFQHEAVQRYLYTGNDGLWYIGSRRARERGWDCMIGYIRYDLPHGGAAPDKLAGPWSLGEGSCWIKTPDIKVCAEISQ